MDFSSYIQSEYYLIVVLLYCIGIFIKSKTLIKNNYIPMLLSILGVGLVCLMNIVDKQDPIITSSGIIQGIACGLSAVGSNQIYQQFMKNKEDDDEYDKQVEEKRKENKKKKKEKKKAREKRKDEFKNKIISFFSSSSNIKVDPVDIKEPKIHKEIEKPKIHKEIESAESVIKKKKKKEKVVIVEEDPIENDPIEESIGDEYIEEEQIEEEHIKEEKILCDNNKIRIILDDDDDY